MTLDLTTRCASPTLPADGADGAAAAAAAAAADAADAVDLKLFISTSNEPALFAQLLGAHKC